MKMSWKNRSQILDSPGKVLEFGTVIGWNVQGRLRGMMSSRIWKEEKIMQQLSKKQNSDPRGKWQLNRRVFFTFICHWSSVYYYIFLSFTVLSFFWKSCYSVFSMIIICRKFLLGNFISVASILSCGWWHYGQFCYTPWSTLLVQTGNIAVLIITVCSI